MTKWTGWIVAALALAALAAGAVYAATSSAEVRITARQMEDGRVEFALQQRVDGEWGERILPTSRFFPADVGHNRWLNSTPITVSMADAEASVASGTYTPQRIPEGNNEDGSIIWGTRDTSSGFRSFVAVTGQTNDGTYDRAVVYIGCDHDAPNAAVHMSVALFWAIGQTTRFSSHFDADRFAGYRLGTTYDENAVTGNTSNGLVSVEDGRVWMYGDNLLRAAKAKRWLSVLVPHGYDDNITATFDLSRAWQTPVQQNLERCGG